MPGKNQVYGADYKTISITVTPEEHREYKIKAATYEVTVADVCRLALTDDSMWRKAQKQRKRGEG